MHYWRSRIPVGEREKIGSEHAILNFVIIDDASQHLKLFDVAVDQIHKPDTNKPSNQTITTFGKIFELMVCFFPLAYVSDTVLIASLLLCLLCL